MPSSQLVFGPFRLDPDHACLWRDAEAMVLPPKAFAVLHYLVTHPDRLVTKDELLDAVWPETAVTDAVCATPSAYSARCWAIRRRHPGTLPLCPAADTASWRRSRSTPRRRLAPLSQCRPQYSRHQRCGRLVRRRRRWTRWQCTPNQGVAPLPGALPPPEAERRYLRGRGRRRRGGGTPGALSAGGDA